MKYMNYTYAFLAFLVCSGLLTAGAAGPALPQETENVSRLAPKYRIFLDEARLVISDEEKTAFIKLESDADRDLLIERFPGFQKGNSKVRSNINTLMLLRMVENLNLTEEQSAKLFPVFTRIEREKMMLSRTLMHEMNALREELRKDKPDPIQVKELLSSAREKRDSLMAKEREMESIIGQELTIIQQAKHMIFMQDFLRNLRQRFSRAKIMNQKRR